MSDWFIGIDGGGTRTRAVVLDHLGNENARAQGPAALADPRNPEAAAGPISTVARFAAQAAGRSLPCTGLWAGMAGTGRESVRSMVQLAVSKLGLARFARVGTDVHAAFQDAFGAGPGILLIAGTGSIAWGRSEHGLEGRAGGWGSLLGDEGSGYAIGLESLRRVARNEDGRGPETRLAEAILSQLGLEKVEALVSWAAEASKSDIAALVPAVMETSRKGDAVAGEILVKAAEELTEHVLAVFTNLGPWSDPPSVALAGGLLQPGGPLRRALEMTVTEHQLRLLEREPDAARGAARLARDLGIEVRS